MQTFLNQFKRLCLMLSICMGFFISSNAASVWIDGLYYNLTSSTKTAALTYQNTGTTNYSGKINIVIPEKVTYGGVEYTVTEIEDKAFANCTSLESISIPGTVTQVGTTVAYTSNYTSDSESYTKAGPDLPFYKCANLKSVRFEDGTQPLYLGVAAVGTGYMNSTNASTYCSYSKGLFYYCELEELYLGRNIDYQNYKYGSTTFLFSSYPQYYGYSAFYNQTQLKKVTIGEYVTSLPQYVFYQGTSLTYVDFGSSVKEVPNYGFSDCSSLTSAILPPATKTIANHAFENCTNLKTVSIPGVTTIGVYAFYNNSNLSSLELSNSLKSIGSCAFSNSTALKSVSFPNTLASLGGNAFQNSGILSVTIPSSVTVIVASCFKGSKIQSVSFGENNVKLEELVFADCTSLTDVTIASGQQTISEGCFSGCTSLKNVSLSEGLTTIEDKAFANCTSLESISIPGTVTKIGTTHYMNSNSPSTFTAITNLPFYNCTSLKSVRFEDGTDKLTVGCYYNNFAGLSYDGKSLFVNCQLEEIYLGRYITCADYSTSSSYKTFSGYPQLYGYSAFYNQKKLKKVTIGENVTSLHKYIFKGCNNIASIISLSKSPATVESNGFDNYNASLYYPNGSSSYTSTLPWSNFTQSYAMQSEGNLIFIPTSDTQAMVAKYPGTSPESITIPESIASNGKTLSVTKVMESAFAACDNLTNVSFPSSVTEIGDGAFARNEKLASITFNGQKKIGKNAFSDCKSITTLTLPSTVEEIGKRAFYNIPSLTQVSFGSSLKKIDKEAFASCGSLTAARMPNTLEAIETSAFENCSKLTFVSVGTSLKTLGNRAFFNCKVLTEIEVPGTTTSIGEQAFENCENLALATLNSGTKTIGANCFKNCVNLTTFSIPGTVTTVGEGAFDDCIMLSSVSFLAGVADLWIPYFSDCPIRTLRIGRNLKYTYGETGSPFRNKASINRVSFTGNYVTNLYNNLFDGCTGITSITLPTSLKSVNDYAFHKCTGLNEIIIPEGLKTIGNYCFNLCSTLQSIDLPEGVTSVGNSAFEDCSSLKAASLPSTLESLNQYLFYNCTSLEQVNFKEGLKDIGTRVFENCVQLDNIYLPASTSNIYSNAFKGCTSLSNLRFEDSNTSLSIDVTRSMFADSPLKTMYIGRNINYSYSTPSNVPFYQKEQLKEVIFSENENFTTILPYFIYGANSLESLVVPDNITSAGKYAFANCSSMESIQLSNSLPLIEEGLMQNCSSLKSLIIPASVLTVENYALGGCSALTYLWISDSNEAMTAKISADSKGMCRETSLENLYIGRNINYGYSPFYGISTLKNVTFNMNGNISTLGNYFLQNCSAVESLDLPESLTSIGTYSLSGMTSLASCRMRNNVTSVDSYAFAYDEKLVDLTFSNNVTTLKDNLFNGCSSLPKFTIYPGVTSIQNNVFTDCSSLSNVTFENGTDNLQIARKYVSSSYSSLFADCPIESLYLGRWLIYEIGDDSWSPFYGQKSLVNLTFGETVGDIGKFLFEKCSSLEKVEIPGVESIGEKSFFDCSKLSYVKFNTGTRSLGEYAFSECVELDNVKLPSTVVSLSDGCFMNCMALNTVEMGSSLEIIGPNSFAGCSNLQNADIPESVYGLGVESFKGCISLPYINIPKGISSVGARSFQGCTGAEWLTLSERCTSLGANSFDGCTSIRYIKSFNPNPPVGLPNFATNVVDNGTVFVPADALADYEDADIWWEFFKIKPMTDAKFVSYVNLDTKEQTLKATQTVQLNAQAGPDDATDTSVGFVSDNNDVATVDDKGLVTAMSIGEANIKVYAKDGSGFYQTCKISVVPTLAERIDLSAQEMNLRVNRKGQLTAEIFPATTTNKDITWTSSNKGVATIDDEGNIRAIYDGVTTLKAEAKDGSGTVATCTLTVIAPMSGDSNDNDAVTITDAVNTANYAVGNGVESFNFRAADVNGDNRITLADASGTVAIILDQPVESSYGFLRAKALMAENENDFLVMENFSVQKGQKVSVPVMLDNTLDYVALQADVTVPEGMKLESITVGNRAEGTHSLMIKRIGENTMRIVLFDLNNSVFTDNNEALFEINLVAKDAEQGEIIISNIIASDADAHEYNLYASGGRFSDQNGIEATGSSAIHIEGSVNEVNVFRAEGCEVAIYAMDGAMIGRFTAKSEAESFKIIPGIYVVVAGDYATKVIVK